MLYIFPFPLLSHDRHSVDGATWDRQVRDTCLVCYEPILSTLHMLRILLKVQVYSLHWIPLICYQLCIRVFPLYHSRLSVR